MAYWTDDDGITIIDNPAAPRIYADTGQLITGATMTRLALYERLLDDPRGDGRIIGHLIMPLRGWTWMLTNTRARKPPLPGLFDGMLVPRMLH